MIGGGPKHIPRGPWWPWWLWWHADVLAMMAAGLLRFIIDIVGWMLMEGMDAAAARWFGLADSGKS